jgi:hypothetical protein
MGMYESPFQFGLSFPVSIPKKSFKLKSELELMRIGTGTSPYFFLCMGSKILKISY